MLIIDRFEGDFAICETGAEYIRIPRGLIPPDASEGDVLSDTESGTYILDKAAANARREAAKRRFAALVSAKKQ